MLTRPPLPSCAVGKGKWINTFSTALVDPHAPGGAAAGMGLTAGVTCRPPCLRTAPHPPPAPSQGSADLQGHGRSTLSKPGPAALFGGGPPLSPQEAARLERQAAATGGAAGSADLTRFQPQPSGASGWPATHARAGPLFGQRARRRLAGVRHGLCSAARRTAPARLPERAAPPPQPGGSLRPPGPRLRPRRRGRVPHLPTPGGGRDGPVAMARPAGRRAGAPRARPRRAPSRHAPPPPHPAALPPRAPSFAAG